MRLAVAPAELPGRSVVIASCAGLTTRGDASARRDYRQHAPETRQRRQIIVLR